jgi:cyclase
MLQPRIIPCLLIRNKGLVKTVNFMDGKYVGDPINTVRIFNEKEVDELIVLDIDATSSGKEPDYQMIGHLAEECRMPLCYGGGVRSIEQAQRIFGLGVEKIAISSAAVERPHIGEEAADRVGRQSVIVVLDIRTRSKGSVYEVWSHNGKTNTGKCPIEFARQLEAYGAGEIVLNSIDRDGTMVGYDIDLAEKVRNVTNIPLTVLGGAGSLQDIKQLIRRLGVIGAAAGSLFVFNGIYRAVLINYPARAEKDALISSAMYKE